MVDVVVATYNETQNAYQATNYLVSPGTEYALPIGSNLSAYDFAGWVVVPDLSSLGRVPMLLSDEDLLPSYHRMKVEDKTVVVAACYKTTSLT